MQDGVKAWRFYTASISYWISIVSRLLTLLYLTAICDRYTSAECPRYYWDESSKLCSDPLYAVLEELELETVPKAVRFNKTCRAWRRTNSCYQRLILRCQDNGKASEELQMHLNRYEVYSYTCSNPKPSIRLVDCFLPQIRRIKSCTEIYDKYYREYLLYQQYGNACRIISAALRCYHEKKESIYRLCETEGAQQYQTSYIQPMVEHTRVLVQANCTLYQPYSSYYSSTHRPVLNLWLFALLYAFQVH